MRKKCADEMIKRDTPGYAIGGLSGGEAKDDFWKMVSCVAASQKMVLWEDNTVKKMTYLPIKDAKNSFS